ncbi:unnamed protein product [Rhizoctonia solani]|uniref:Uncharacterized protein n=1 Tax=Rhizoctonia solani TaxID=456999 RepID=A0A8H2WI51_9AGAM|nr:unnamed protein product [Rhizoctonia solani]
MQHVRAGGEPGIDTVPLPPDYEEEDPNSIHSTETYCSLSTCSLLSTWSLLSMRGWDESTRMDSAITTRPGEKIDTNPYTDTEIWTTLPVSNTSGEPGHAP